jgi:sugar-specific transcriptional regulator TrmB
MNTSILEDLGLTQAEIKTYIALLELGSSTAGPILEKANIQNSVLHRALHSLIGKGLITYILESKRRIYQATNPENFHDFIENKRRRFDQLLPELQKKQQLAKVQTAAEIFRGKRGLTQMYTTILNCGGKEYNTFGGGTRVTHNVMGEFWWKNLHAKRLTKRLKCRQVFDETIRKFGQWLNKKKLTKIRFLPKQQEQLQETIICGDYVGIAIFTESPYGVLIHDPVVADSYRKQFEILWKKSCD